MLQTLVFPVCIVGSWVNHRDVSLQNLLVDFHSAPTLSDVMGLISGLKSEQNNLHPSFHSILIYIGRNINKNQTLFILFHSNTKTIVSFMYVNVPHLNLSSEQIESFSTSHKWITPVFFSSFSLRSSSLRCERFEGRAELRLRHCFSVILHPHRLKTEIKTEMTRVYNDILIEELQIFCLIHSLILMCKGSRFYA